LIARIEELGERQRKLAELIAKTIAELDAIPPDVQGDAAAKRTDLEQHRTFTTRSFEAVQRTMRYACEVPAESMRASVLTDASWHKLSNRHRLPID
jgi:hypothetical protein